MAEQPAVLAQGTVDTTDEAVYSPTADAIVRLHIRVPTGASTVEGIIVRLSGTGASNIVDGISELGAGEKVVFGPYALEGSVDTLRVQSTVGDDTAAYTVEGIEFS